MTKAPDSSFLRRLREQQGRRAENAAALWLRLKGYGIVARRLSTPGGEIDLIARRNKTLVFVAVKSGKTRDEAFTALPSDLRLRLEQAARVWVSARPHLQSHPWRFDIVLLAPGRLPRHRRDAWPAEA